MGAACAEKAEAGEKGLGGPRTHIGVASIGGLAQSDLPSPSTEIRGTLAIMVNKMSRLHAGGMMPRFRIEAACAEKDQPN
eukprot:7952943-Pyramimonas_sp.AAC.1